MPSAYAHYRFGTQIVGALHGEILANRAYFDLGLQGPDLFYFYNPIFKNRVDRLGDKYHAMTGRAFFGRAAALLREHPDPKMNAFITGFLAHYALDARCHPYVFEAIRREHITHAALESEFERFLMDRDGVTPGNNPLRQKTKTLKTHDLKAILPCLPQVGLPELRQAFWNMDGIQKRIYNQRSSLWGLAMGIVGRGDHMPPKKENPRCRSHNGPMLALYEQTLRTYPELLEDFQETVLSGRPLSKSFDACFDRYENQKNIGE